MDEPRTGKAMQVARPKPEVAGVPRVNVDGNIRFDGENIKIQIGTGTTSRIQFMEGETEVGYISVTDAYVMVFTVTATGGTVLIAPPITLGTTITLQSGLKLEQGALTLANGDNNNVDFGDPPHAHLLVGGPTGAFAITGILPHAADGAVVFLANGTNQVMTIKNNSGSSSVGNKILTGTGADVVTNHAILVYDLTNTVWRLY